MAKPSTGPTPKSVRTEKAELMWVMMSRSNESSSGFTFKIFLVLFKILCSILHLLCVLILDGVPVKQEKQPPDHIANQNGDCTHGLQHDRTKAVDLSQPFGLQAVASR